MGQVKSHIDEIMLLAFAAVVLPVAAAESVSISSNGGALLLSVDSTTLKYTIEDSNGLKWFDSSSSSTGGYGAALSNGFSTLADNTLVPVAPPSKREGHDAAGSYSSITIPFASKRGAGAAGAAADAEWIATFKAYHDRTAFVFGQTWPKAVSNAKGGSVFPTLHQQSKGQLGTLEYTGASCGFMVSATAGPFPDIIGGSGQGYARHSFHLS